MALSIPNPAIGPRFTILTNAFAQGEDQPFREALTDDLIEQAAAASGADAFFGRGPRVIYTLPVTLWAFVTQCVSASKCCVAAVSRVIFLRLGMDLARCSAATGAYCKARAKLPEPFLKELTYQVGERVEDEAPSPWRLHDRRVLLVDGFEATMEDTPANQMAYPQPTSQGPGLGFPMIRAVVLLTFATAVITGAAFGPYAGKQTGETALFRQLFDRLRRGDIVVADRYYCSYFMIAQLQSCGVDVAFRLHQLRDYDFRRGQRLGKNDHIVEWQRPQRPDWMDAATYASMPATIKVREVRFRVDASKSRSRVIVVATTLLDDQQYTSADVAELFHQRWHAELDIRAIKQTLRMEFIACKTPEMVRKALWAHLLGYNLVRKVAAQAAWMHGRAPRQISFAATMQILKEMRPLLLASEGEQRRLTFEALFKSIASHRVGARPGRVEPRRLKRRQGKYKYLRMRRAQARAAMRRGQLAGTN